MDSARWPFGFFGGAVKRQLNLRWPDLETKRNQVSVLMSIASRSTMLNQVHDNASGKFSFLLESPLQSSIAILAPAILSQAAPALTQNNKKYQQACRAS